MLASPTNVVSAAMLAPPTEKVVSAAMFAPPTEKVVSAAMFAPPTEKVVSAAMLAPGPYREGGLCGYISPPPPRR